MTRAAAVIISNGRVALIERRRDGDVYYLFPGGHVEEGETLAQTVRREVWEELGLEVEAGRMLAEVIYDGVVQSYFLAEIRGGSFGSGTGAETWDITFTPVWLPIEGLSAMPVYPRPLAVAVEASASGWLETPLRFVDEGRPRAA
jgi:8-oxo-dGTP pyrophosphatase MutT (NUDIX family)